MFEVDCIEQVSRRLVTKQRGCGEKGQLQQGFWHQFKKAFWKITSASQALWFGWCNMYVIQVQYLMLPSDMRMCIQEILHQPTSSCSMSPLQMNQCFWITIVHSYFPLRGHKPWLKLVMCHSEQSTHRRHVQRSRPYEFSKKEMELIESDTRQNKVTDIGYKKRPKTGLVFSYCIVKHSSYLGFSQEKRVGYFGLTQLLDENTEVLMCLGDKKQFCLLFFTT